MNQRITVYLSEDVVLKVDEMVKMLRTRWPAVYGHATRQDAVKQLLFVGYQTLIDIGELRKGD